MHAGGMMITAHSPACIGIGIALAVEADEEEEEGEEKKEAARVV